jgi:serine/threonine-protein kinase
VGTPGYLSPERFAGSPPSPAADVFSAAVVLCELLCGDVSDVLASSKKEAIGAHVLLACVEPQLAALGSHGSSLRTLLVDMLCIDPTARPSAAQVSQRLAACL